MAYVINCINNSVQFITICAKQNILFLFYHVGTIFNQNIEKLVEVSKCTSVVMIAEVQAQMRVSLPDTTSCDKA